MLEETAAAKSEPAFSTNSKNNLPEFKDMEFEKINQLALDHPGASDEEYRTRRDYIAGFAKQFREDPEHKILTLNIRPKSKKSGKLSPQIWKKFRKNTLQQFISKQKRNSASAMSAFRSFRK